MHLIEYKDLKKYIAINKIFEYINQQQYEPTREQREIIECILKEFENEHMQDKNSKGKILIRRDYMIRSWGK